MVAATKQPAAESTAETHDTLLTWPEVCRALRVGETTIRRWQKLGRFPLPIKFAGQRTARFSARQIRNWLSEQYAAAADAMAARPETEPVEVAD